MFKQRVMTLARSAGLEIRSARRHPNLIEFLKSRNIDVVYDVGANVGQFARQIRSSGYSRGIVSFEPLTEAFLQLSAAASSDARWEVMNVALGAVAEQREIHVSEDSVFSSLLDTTDLAVQFDQKARVVNNESIIIRPFDDFGFDLKAKRSFLKIDTQGFERSVLDGASKALRDMQGALLELPVEYLYASTWTLSEAFAYMSARGFVLAQVNPVNSLPTDRVSALELDCLFRRANP